MAELEEEQGGDEGAFSELEKINKAEVNARLKEIKDDQDCQDRSSLLNGWLEQKDKESELKKKPERGRSRPGRQRLRPLPQAERN